MKGRVEFCERGTFLKGEFCFFYWWNFAKFVWLETNSFQKFQPKLAKFAIKTLAEEFSPGSVTDLSKKSEKHTRCRKQNKEI